MGTKRRAVVSADAETLDAVERLVAQGRFRNVSQFVREAMAEKLWRLTEEGLAREVAEWVAEGGDPDTSELIQAQAWPASGSRTRGRSAKG